MNSSTERIVELVIKRLNVQLSEAENAELQDWINQSEENRKAIEDFLDEKKLRAGISHLYKTRERIWKRLHAAIPEKKTIPVRRLLLRYSAAAAIIVMLVSLSYYFISRRTLIAPAITVTDTVQHKAAYDADPGGDRAVLTLADGSKIILDSAADGTLVQQGTIRVIKSDHGQLAYEPGSSTQTLPGTMIYNTLATPRGGQYRLQLPDGSKVWLNAVSSLRYPVSFTGKERSVQLSGEAYFEVAKNAAKPFKVAILSLSGNEQGEVEVLGTHFNINAYGDEPVIKTTLLEGVVKVSANGSRIPEPQTLLPGQQAQISNNELSVFQQVDVQLAVAWKDGLFQLTSADIGTIMRQIARWYDVEITYEGSIPSGHITGKVSRSMQLSNVVKVLELSGIHCRLENKKLVVLPGK